MDKAVIDFLGSGLSIAISMFFYGTIWNIKKVKNHLRVLGFLLVAIINTAVTAYVPNTVFQLMISLITMFFLSFYFESRIFVKLPVSLLASAILAVPEILIVIIIVQLPEIPVEQMQGDLPSYTLGLLVTKLLALLFVCLIRVVFGKEKHVLGRRSDLLMAFMPLQAIFLCLIVYGYIARIDILQNPSLAMTAVVISLLLVFITMFILNGQRKAVTYRKEKDIAQSRLEVQIEHYQELYHELHKVRAVRHEIRNDMIAIMGMLSEGMYKDANERLKEKFVGLMESIEIVSTGLPSVDAVLTAKIKRADEYDIKIDRKISLGAFYELGIDQFDLATIVATALDNSIEGILRANSANKKIMLNIASYTDHISILVVNSATGPIDENFKTSKVDVQNHGFGMAHMKSVAEKYNGTVQPSFDPDSGKFTLKILLCGEAQ